LHTEAELVEGCLNGNRTTQRLLFERFAGQMMSVCRRYTRDRMEAEDMLQDGFVKAFERISQYRDGSLEGWLKRIFVNTCLSNWRKNKLTVLLQDGNQWESIATEEDGLQKLQANELIALIEELPPGARLIFNLFAIEGYPHTEIAVMLSITEGASRAQLTRARQLLQDKLKKLAS